VESRDVNLWLNQTYGEYEGLSPPSQLSTVVHVPLADNADNLEDLDNIENVPPLPTVPAMNVPPSDASTQSNNNNQADAPPELFSPARTINSPVAKRMTRELQPHLLDPIEGLDGDATQANENVRVTRSRKGATTVDLGDAHATMAYLAMCSKYDDFSEFAMVAVEKYDLNVSLTQDQFSTIPQEQYKDYFTVPETFNEAWNHPCPFQRKLWRNAIQKELDKMESNKVYRKCTKSDLPAGRRPIKCKWVFDIKRNGIFRARIVAKGFTQQPGLDCYYQFSPVINDITFRIWLTCVLIWQLQTLVFDVETAFLHGSFCPGEEVYMNCPPGMVHQTDECLLLLKTLYGLIQAARHYFDFFSKILIDIGFQQSHADPCLFLFKNALGLMLVIVYVDDVGLAYSSYALVEFLFNELKKRKINYTVVMTSQII